MAQFLQESEKNSEFDGQVLLLVLETPHGPLRAVFKAGDPHEEWDRWDAEAEVAAFRAACFMGIRRVPPVVIRKIGEHLGSLHLFVDTDMDLLDKETYTCFRKSVSEDEIDALKIFSFVIGQWDTGPHNLLAFKTGDPHKPLLPVAIDNANIRYHQRVRYGELPYILCCSSGKLWQGNSQDLFPFQSFKTLEDVTPELLLENFKPPVLTETFCKQAGTKNPKIRYVMHRGKFWMQYHAFDSDFEKAFASSCPPCILERLAHLTEENIKAFFQEAVESESEFFNEEYISHLLNRRDQVLAFFAKQNIKPDQNRPHPQAPER